MCSSLYTTRNNYKNDKPTRLKDIAYDCYKPQPNQNQEGKEERLIEISI